MPIRHDPLKEQAHGHFLAPAPGFAGKWAVADMAATPNRGRIASFLPPT
ncbi:hypothetical protein CPter91_1432 [Collimonas pratensis]|uniref:Uncharacterized protein n=1 Tax=Collimonas pratensis TaxID=279113 RepID=A0A127Q2F9_9BURK|nr:hypothetical protein CPter91_1432 [Collimonas pratensis]